MTGLQVKFVMLGCFRKLQRNSALAKESQPRPQVQLVDDPGDNKGSCRDLGTPVLADRKVSPPAPGVCHSLPHPPGAPTGMDSELQEAGVTSSDGHRLTYSVIT